MLGIIFIMDRMNYVIDINRPRTKLAMLALGIEPEELIQKTLEDFSGRGVSEEVQKLRFNYYTRKLQEVVRQINAFIREETMRRLQSSVTPSNKTQVFLTQVTQEDEEVDEMEAIKKREHMKIKQKLKSLNDSMFIAQGIDKRFRISDEVRLRVKSEIVEKRSKFNKFKDKQIDNLAKIKELQTKKARAFNPQKRNFKSKFESASRYSKTLTDFNESDDEISSKIQTFENKMLRSQRLYEKSLQQKKDAASKLLEGSFFRKVEEKVDFDPQKIAQMIEKRKKVEARRHSYIAEMQEHRDSIREKHEKRRSVALEKMKMEEKNIKERNLAIERRMEASARLLKSNHDKLVKELELKNELSKLRDEEALLNAERKRRIM
jgi:hypothetical protein